jgi:2-iminobutanoate/2-iminopropanoate deaminase
MKTYGPYSPIRQAGQTFYISGQVGINASTGVAVPDVAAQTERALLNLETVLQSAGLGLDDVIKTTIFMADMGDFEAMNAIYEQRFSTPRPARSTVAAKELPRLGGNTPLLVEIEAVAYREQA